MMDEQHGVPVGSAGDREMVEAGDLGSRPHIRQTLARAQSSVQIAGERVATRRSLLARTTALVSGATSPVQASTPLRAELRASVTAYVRHLRDDGVPPERMLVLVKTAMRESTPSELDSQEARTLLEDVVRWSVDAYYAAA
jgi:hypothetical protein